MLMERLVLFDIDGTLTRTQNGYVPFNEAILRTFGVAGDIRSVLPDGNTDPRIVEDVLAQANIKIAIDESMWLQFSINLRDRYIDAVQNGTIAIRALPGASALIQALDRSDSFNASVVTGNLEAVAEVKLQTAGLHHHLLRGAYGSDSPHRPDLPPIAKQRWQKTTGRRIALGNCIIIGDTPKDLEAACQNSMKCVLVGTGRYPVEELRYCGPDACIPDLSDTNEIIGLLSDL